MHDYNYSLKPRSPKQSYWLSPRWYLSRAVLIPLILLVIVLSVLMMNHYNTWYHYVIFGWIVVKAILLFLEVIIP